MVSRTTLVAIAAHMVRPRLNLFPRSYWLEGRSTRFINVDFEECLRFWWTASALSARLYLPRQGAPLLKSSAPSPLHMILLFTTVALSSTETWQTILVVIGE